MEDKRRVEKKKKRRKRREEKEEKKMDVKVEMRSIRLLVTHFKNSRTHKTICGKNYKTPKRKVTNRLDKVSCGGCLNSIRTLKWVKEMIERRNRTSKSPQEIIDTILREVGKSS